MMQTGLRHWFEELKRAPYGRGDWRQWRSSKKGGQEPDHDGPAVLR